MVDTQPTPFFWDLDLSAFLARGLAMAALFGGLVTLPAFVDSWQLNGELKPTILNYTISCPSEKQKQSVDGTIQQQGCTEMPLRGIENRIVEN